MLELGQGLRGAAIAPDSRSPLRGAGAECERLLSAPFSGISQEREVTSTPPVCWSHAQPVTILGLGHEPWSSILGGRPVFLIKSSCYSPRLQIFSPSLSRKGRFDPCPFCSHLTGNLPCKTRCLSPSLPHSLPFPFVPAPQSCRLSLVPDGGSPGPVLPGVHHPAHVALHRRVRTVPRLPLPRSLQDTVHQGCVPSPQAGSPSSCPQPSLLPPWHLSSCPPSPPGRSGASVSGP